MAEIGLKNWRITRCIMMAVISIVAAWMLTSADGSEIKEDLAAAAADVDDDMQFGYFVRLAESLFQTNGSGYQHVWPNVCWKELGLLVIVWIAFLVLQIAKTYTSTCSIGYWVLELLQVPVSFGVSGYEAISLYNGSRKISSRVDSDTDLQVGQLILYCFCGVLAGMVGGLLGIGGGSILGTLFLELGIPPQVSSATAIFAMMFSSSMSVVEYYLLNRFPIPYASYLVVVAIIAAFVGQHVVRRIVIIVGRASIIIFILASTVFVSVILLGGVGIANMVDKIQQHEYMGFENLCKYEV